VLYKSLQRLKHKSFIIQLMLLEKSEIFYTNYIFDFIRNIFNVSTYLTKYLTLSFFILNQVCIYKRKRKFSVILFQSVIFCLLQSLTFVASLSRYVRFFFFCSMGWMLNIDDINAPNCINQMLSHSQLLLIIILVRTKALAHIL
jgi:hypothetical protein